MASFGYQVLGFGSGGASVRPAEVDYLVVGGGGGGYGYTGGGGGGGGMRSSYPGGTKLVLAKAENTVTVGSGAPDSASPNTGSAIRGGTTSIEHDGGTFSTTGGGGGSTVGNDIAPDYSDGGSGGGGCHQGVGGDGNLGSYSPVEGYDGGNSCNSSGACGNFNASGGGGAGGAGSNNNGGVTGAGTPGGGGAANSITGSPVTYAGGGGGGAYWPGTGGGSGGSGGGGGVATDGSNGLGGGGGGGTHGSQGTANGGNGIVYIRVPASEAAFYPDLAVAPGSNTLTTVGSDKLATFNVSGTLNLA